MKRRFLYIILISISFSAVISCKVDEIPETELSDAIFWNTTSDLRMAANYFYTTLPELRDEDVTEDAWSPYAFSASSPNKISDGSRVAPATDDDYSYKKIFQANKLIEQSAEVLAKGGKEAEVNWYVGEARFFRAFYYYELFKRFGGVPLIDKTLGVNDPDVFKERATREELFNFILADLDYATSVLRSADELAKAGEYGRISKSAALAFKSRVTLFEGTRQKFHQYGNYRETLKLAKAAAEEVMNAGDYTLFTQPRTGMNGEQLNDAYFNLFQEAGEGRANKENIIVKVYGISRENQIVSTAVQRFYESNRVLPTQNFVSKYLMADGLPIEKSPLYQEPNKQSTHADYFKMKDPRMTFTLFKRGDEFISSSNYTIPRSSAHSSGYGIRKYANKTFWNLQASYIDKPVLRYAEVLLTYAEAVYELEGTISDADLDRTINLIRARLPQVNISTASSPAFVSMPKLSNTFVSGNGLDMREEIRRERLVELAFEGFAYWDLLRWKTAEVEMPKAIRGGYLFTEYLTGASGWDPKTPVDDKNYLLLQPANLRKFDPQKDYLWPIPLTEIAKNPKIVQNPKW